MALDRAGWPRLTLSGGNSVAGDDAWRPWLREASLEDLEEVLEALRTRRAEADLHDEDQNPSLFDLAADDD